MRLTAGFARGAVLTAALLAGLTAVSHLAAADDEALKKAALKLNDITGAEPSEKKIDEFRKKDKADEAKKLVKVAAGMIKDKGKDEPFTPNATYILARVAQDAKENDISEKFYRVNIEQSRKLQSAMRINQAYLGLVSLLYDSKKYAAAEKACQDFLDTDLDDEEANQTLDRARPIIIRRLIMTHAKQSNYDKAYDLLDKLAKAQPGNPFNLDLKARLKREENKYDDAIKIYDEMITQIQKERRLTKEEREALVADVRYTLSGLYVEMKQVDKAADQLKKLLEKEPDNPTYNNDLGYIWADHDMNLDEAEKMIKKALEEDRKLQKKDNPDQEPKDNPAYLDSLGWVLYKKKQYKEALPHLQEAVKSDEGKHTEIYDHLGDCLLKLDKKKEAVAAWEEAVKVAGDNKREKERKAEVEKKLKDNK